MGGGHEAAERAGTLSVKCIIQERVGSASCGWRSVRHITGERQARREDETRRLERSRDDSMGTSDRQTHTRNVGTERNGREGNTERAQRLAVSSDRNEKLELRSEKLRHHFTGTGNGTAQRTTVSSASEEIRKSGEFGLEFSARPPGWARCWCWATWASRARRRPPTTSTAWRPRGGRTCLSVCPSRASSSGARAADAAPPDSRTARPSRDAGRRRASAAAGRPPPRPTERSCRTPSRTRGSRSRPSRGAAPTRPPRPPPDRRPPPAPPPGHSAAADSSPAGAQTLRQKMSTEARAINLLQTFTKLFTTNLTLTLVLESGNGSEEKTREKK